MRGRGKGKMFAVGFWFFLVALIMLAFDKKAQ